MKYSLLLIIIVIALAPNVAFGLSTSTFDIIKLDDSTNEARFYLNPRVYDGNSWENFVYSNTADYIRFESGKSSFEYYKDTCDFKVYPGGLISTNPPDVDSYSYSISVDNTSLPIPTCSIQNFSNNQTGIYFESKSGPATVIFNLDFRRGIEWTYDLPISGNIQITEVCKGCNNYEELTPTKFKLGNYILDTKNEQHGAFNSSQIINDDLILKYEKLSTGSIIIDPAFTPSSNADSHVRDADNDNTCEDTGAGSYDVVDTSLYSFTYATTGSADCIRSWLDFDVSGFPAANILSARLDLWVSSVSTTENHDIYIITSNQPSTRTNAQAFDEINNDAICVNNQSISSTGWNNFTLTSCLTEINSHVDSSSWIGFGILLDDEILTASNRGAIIHSEAHANPPVLSFTYPNDHIETTIIENSSILGDTARIFGTIEQTFPAAGINFTKTSLIVNGSTITTNSTIQNFTGTDYWPVNFNFWYRMTTNDLYNFTTQITAQNSTHTITNSTSILNSLEYTPDYFTATVPTQGTVNYTFPGESIIQINRIIDDPANLTETWQIECSYFTQSDAFFGNLDSGTWDNETNVGAYSNNYAGFYYVSCYNDDLLFTTALDQNFNNSLTPGLIIFDQLGGFFGAPSIVLVIIAILSLGTGRNFPIIITIAASVTGILWALDLIVIDNSIFVAIMIITGISLFGVRKFY